ncbi:MAG TPA: hypothetical protein VGL56_19420 [Fimbriimonadaceae bacterium]
MRLRYIFGVWIAGALVLGFALGQIVERNLFIEALSKRNHEFSTPVFVAPTHSNNVHLSPGLRV